MKFNLFLFTLFICYLGFAQLPKGFVYANDIIPDLVVDLRYYSSNNFVGKPIDGYNNKCLILTKNTTSALKVIQDELRKKNLGLKVYDGYRPQRAVNHFISWARDLNDTINKSRFYPDVDKKNLFKEEYIASRSGHTKGSTVDLTIMNLDTMEDLDMGSNYDFFGMQSWVDYEDITNEQKANRQLLQDVMLKNGFRNYPKEWWHFTLRSELFPDTFFDFPIE